MGGFASPTVPQAPATAMDSPIQPLVVPAAAIPQPATPAPTLPSTPFTHPTTGEFAGQWTKQLMQRYGIEAWKPDLAGPLLRQPLPVLPPDDAQQLQVAPSGLGGEITFDPSRMGDLPYLYRLSGVRQGLRESFLGTVAAMDELHKSQAVHDPDYDPWADPQIRDAGFDNQMNLFHGSTSRESTRWMIQRMRERQREAEWVERAPGYAHIGQFAGGLLGDPLTYLPGTVGIRGALMLSRMSKGLLTGAEMESLAARPALYGALADGVRSSAVQVGLGIVENAVQHNLDPTIPIDISTDLLIPAAIGGSVGLITGAMTRVGARRLAQDVAREDFLKPPGPRAYGAPSRPGGIAGEPTIPPATPRPLAESRTMAEAHAALDRLETARGTPGEAQAFREATEAWRKATADRPSPNGGAFPDGALNTDYGPLRTAEHKANPASVGFTTEPVGRLVDREFKPGELPEAGTAEHPHPIKGIGPPADYRGSLFLSSTGGPTLDVADFPVGYHLRDDAGTLWRVKEGKLEGDARKSFVTVSEAPKPKPGAGARIVDQEFKPGELEATTEGPGQRGFLDDPTGEAAAATHHAPGAKYAQTETTSEGAHQPGSVGAQLSPDSLAYQESVLLAQGRLVPTGIGLEKLPLNPVVRAFQGASVAAMRLVADLVSTGGVQTMANRQGIANMAPVETLIQMTWNRPMVQALRHTTDEWTAYRKAMAGVPDDPNRVLQTDGRSDLSRISGRVGTALKDLVTPGEKPLSYGQFNARVGVALRRGDVDELEDAASAYINRAAAKHRELYERVKREAVEAGVFDEAYQGAVYDAQSELRALKKEADQTKIRAYKEKWSPTQLREAEEALLVRHEDATFRFHQTEQLLKNLRDNGPRLDGTAPTYRPRLYKVDKLLDGEERFMEKAVGWLQSKAGGALDVQEAARIAKQIHEILTKQNPIYDRGDVAALFKGVAAPGSAMARSFKIPDQLIAEFLEDDAETLLRYHMKQMGTAIEMKKRFGSLDLADEISEIERDYRNAIIEANKGSDVPTDQAKLLTKQMKTAIADAQALRDKLYGTYGASPDPHRWQSRTIRMAKQFNNLTLLGMSGISALGDLVRPVMTEGLEAVYGYGFKSLISESRATILKMNRLELELEGNGMELYNNVRALSAADTGDVFGSRGKVENAMNAANSWMFVANGLNMVNQVDKEWARLSIGGRVNRVLLDLLGHESIGTPAARYAHLADNELEAMVAATEAKLATQQPSRFVARTEAQQALRSEIAEYQRELASRASFFSGPGGSLSEIDRGRFAAAGIDEAMGKRIALQLKIHGIAFGEGRGALIMPNTEKWEDEVARTHYRSAMNQMVNRTVPTPGIGDRPNFMSSEIGGLLTQYKSFGVASLVRGAYSGMQEGGNQFWYGAAMAVGFAALLNEVRSQLFYGKSSFDKPTTAILADAVDRSSILGVFSDGNRAIEQLTGHRVGLNPMLGNSRPSDPSLVGVAGALGGPSVQQAARAVSIANDHLSGHPTAQTWRNWRALTLGGTLPYLDPAFDAIYPTDYPSARRKKERVS